MNNEIKFKFVKPYSVKYKILVVLRGFDCGPGNKIDNLTRELSAKCVLVVQLAYSTQVNVSYSSCQWNLQIPRVFQ